MREQSAPEPAPEPDEEPSHDPIPEPELFGDDDENGRGRE